MTITTIRERGMLVRLSIGRWTGKVKDLNVGKEVAAHHQATAKNPGEYTKYLMPKDELDAIGRVEGAARNAHYKLTLPWADNGERILCVDGFDRYRDEISRYKSEYENVTRTFMNKWDTLYRRAIIEHGSLFSPSDYPSKESVREKFYFDLDFRPVPDSADFRVNINDKELEKIRHQINQANTDNLKSAMTDVWDRLYKVVDKMAVTLHNFDPNGKGKDRGKFRDSLVNNIADICSVLPALNITMDSDLEALRKRVEKKLTAFSAQDLRESDGARTMVAKDASELTREIMDRMKWYAGSSGGA